MAPVAVAREPHDLPGRTVDRQLLGAGDATVGIEAVDVRRVVAGLGLAAEQLLGGRFRIVRMRERWQRLRIERALVLRERGRGRERQEKQGADERLSERVA